MENLTVTRGMKKNSVLLNLTCTLSNLYQFTGKTAHKQSSQLTIFRARTIVAKSDIRSNAN